MKNILLAALLFPSSASAAVTLVEGKVSAAPTAAVTTTLSASTDSLRVDVNTLSNSSAALNSAKYDKAGGAITGGLSLTDSVGGPSGAGYNEVNPAPAGNMVSNSSGTVVRTTGVAGFGWILGSLYQGHGYGNTGSNYTGVCHGGTEASPTACPSGSDIIFMGGKPYDGTNATTGVGSNAAIRFQAAEAASPSGRGTRITLSTTKNATTSRRARISLLDTGDMVLAPRSDAFSPSGAKLEVTGVDAGIGEAGNGVSIKAHEQIVAGSIAVGSNTVSGPAALSLAGSDSNIGAQILNDGGQTSIAQWAYNDDPGSANYLTSLRARGSVASPTAILAGDTIGGIVGFGHDGTDFGGIPPAIMLMKAVSDFDGSSKETQFQFLTVPSGSIFPTIPLTLTSSNPTMASEDTITLQAANTVLVNANLLQTQDMLMFEGGAGTNLVMHSDDAEVNNKNWELSARPTGTWSLTRQDDAFGGISTPLLADATGNLMVTDSNSRFFSDGSLSIREFAADDATPEANLDVNGDARFGSGGVTTIGSDGEITIAENSALVLSGATGDITTASSVTASGFFGNGSALVGVLDNTKVLKAGDTMTGALTMSGAGANIVSGSSITASGFFGASLELGANIVYYCTGSTAGTFDGNLARGNGNAGACAGGTWVATSLKVD